MVGRLFVSLLPFFLTGLSLGQDCSKFRKEYCNLELDKIMALETNMESPAECQTACYDRENCTEFTFFSGRNSRCVLFSSCSTPVSSCKSCVSGPVWPRLNNCDKQLLKEEKRNKGSGTRNSGSGIRNSGSGRNNAGSGQNNASSGRRNLGSGRRTAAKPRSAFQAKSSSGPSQFPLRSASQGEGKNVNKIPISDDKEYGENGSFDDVKVDMNKDDDEEEVNIDDGLLDEVFQDLPGTGSATPPSPTVKPRPRRPKPSVSGARNKTISGCPSCPGNGFYYCIMGGSNDKGPVSTVSVMNIGTYPVPRSPLITPFPSFMTRGSGRTFSVYSGSSLNTCTPGYPVTTLTPASTFHGGFGPGGFGPGLFGAHQTFVPGTCNDYNFRSRQWQSNGGKMTTAREGGSTLNVGNYIMSFGGFNPFGQPVKSVEIYDPRRPQVGWQGVPQWSFPRATRDQCTVVTKDPKLGTQVMVMGGVGEEHSVMKLVLSQNNWFSVPPMNYPRTQHGCTSVTLNGRPGVVVSGGVDSNRFNTSSVEFFDINTHRWVNLPNLSRGRRGHTMTTVEGQLAVAGGSALRHEGDIEYLDDVEIFDGRRWKRAAYGLDQPRNGANLIKIPFSTFE